MHFEFFDFIRFVLNQTYGKQYLLGLMISTFIVCTVLFIIFSVNLSYYRDINAEDEEKDAFIVHKFSKYGALYIYDDYCRINCSGTFVSGYLSNIMDVSCSKDTKDRILHVTYIDGKDEKTERIHCGKMDVFEFVKIKELMLKYAGG